MSDALSYADLLRLVDTRAVGDQFPDMLAAAQLRTDRLAELGLVDLTAREVSELRTLRDGLQLVVLDPTAEPGARLTTLNSLLAAYGLVPQLSEDLELRYLSARTGPVAELAERLLPQAVTMLQSGDVDRVLLCAADDCAAPFVAGTTPRARAYCSSRCSTRVRVRRFRAATGA